MYYNIIIHAIVQMVLSTVQTESFFLSSRDYRFLIRRFLDPYPTLRRLSDPKTPSLNDRRPPYGPPETVNRETYRKSHHEEHCQHHHHPYEYDVNRELRQNYNRYLEHGNNGHKTHYSHHYDRDRIPDYHRRVNHEKCRHPNDDHHEHFHRDPYIRDLHDDHYNRRGYQVKAQRHPPAKVSKDNFEYPEDHHKYKQEENTDHNRKGEINVKNNYDDEYHTNIKQKGNDKSNYESIIDIPELLKKQLKDIDKTNTKDYVSGVLLVVPKLLDEKNLDNADNADIADIRQDSNYDTLDKTDNSFQQEPYSNVFQNYFLKNQDGIV